MLEFVGAIDVNSTEQRVLDKLKVEKDRGITVKAQTCSLIYRCAKDGKDYLLNLIDTPGHVDFCSEVSRSISACQGVLLLVDANQGKEIRGTLSLRPCLCKCKNLLSDTYNLIYTTTLSGKKTQNSIRL